jgi:hypothetical protein
VREKCLGHGSSATELVHGVNLKASLSASCDNMQSHGDDHHHLRVQTACDMTTSVSLPLVYQSCLLPADMCTPVQTYDIFVIA